MRSIVNKFRAFQVGICTFRWDQETSRYKYRPFSFLIWPKSKVRDESMVFQSGAVTFLLQNSFDFNKLFENGINYGRYTDQEFIKSRCHMKVMKSLETTRFHVTLSNRHVKVLEQMMKQIEDFVYDPNAKETLTFHIQSYALKKALGKEVTILYMNTGLFTEFTR